MDPIWTDHAAQRVIEKGIDPKAVLAVAKNAIRLGKNGRVYGRGIIVVIEGRTIITVFPKVHEPEFATRHAIRELKGFNREITKEP